LQISGEQYKNLPENLKKHFIQGNFHCAVKPLKLMSYLIVLGSREGDIVLDPFAGSFTTALACRMLNRQWIACDISEEYCKIGEARLSQSALV